MPQKNKVLLVAVFATGFSALLYQVVWQRLLGLFSGSDVLSVTLVTSAFLGGLGVGSLLGSFWADRLRNPVAAFGLCNVGIGLFALGSRFLYYDLLFGRLIALAESRGLLLLVVFVSLLIPTTLMGLSLPLLSRALVQQVENAAHLISLLYGMNTLGAGIGTVFSGWYLIGTVGYATSVYIGGAISLVAGLVGLWLAPSYRRETAATAAPLLRLRGVPGVVWLWGGLVFASGFIAISLEVIWFRMLDVTLKSNAYTFAHLLTFFLVADALGNLAGARVVGRITHPRRAFFWIQGGGALYAVLAVWGVVLAAEVHPLHTYITTASNKLVLTLDDNAIQWFAYLVVPSLMMVPPAFMIGFYFPIVQKAIQTDTTAVGQRVALVDMFNILGNTLGGVVTGMIFLHFLGTPAALRIIALLGLVFVLLLLRELQTQRERGAAGVLAGALLCLALFFPGRVAFWGALHGAGEDTLFLVAEDATGVSALREHNATGMVYANGTHQGNIPFSATHSFLGALPALVHPAPQDVLIIGIGSAGTPGAAGMNPLTQRIKAVEIVGSELDVLRAYEQARGIPALAAFLGGDPRYEIIVGDGRHELLIGDTRYDIIEADAIRPVSSHSGLLYSREYFQAARERLKPGGIMAQWSPTERVIHTFTLVFPYTIQIGDVLLGSDTPIAYDPAAIIARLEEAPIRAYLDTWGIDAAALREKITPPRMVWTPETPRPTSSSNFNTDLFPRDEYYLNNGG